MTTRTGRGRPVTIWSVRVLMRRSEDPGSRWGIPRWELLAVLPDGDPPAAPERKLVHEASGQHDFEWRGLSMPLFRDAAESYWYNLVGREPSLCVICRAGEDIDLEPFAVTANYDEAGAFMEADDTVYKAPLPAELLPELEEFVMTHYKPAEPRKRRRRNWSAEAADGGRKGSDPAGE
ncbi:MAG: DUF3305 domain-containing protein [Halofilum sp. (in: g-proteobacteria)]|nr:DUF3305 domain-containing protein [Halofilum sp. (in: g-proteobacteria)]